MSMSKSASNFLIAFIYFRCINKMKIMLTKRIKYMSSYIAHIGAYFISTHTNKKFLDDW